ncbi:MAG: tRNA (adenosine(37)-N6)-threonylcarbamoyltransferase complex dimerization subunit type 1 TsaB [Muribaculaceae bacterium]|nr:tRNA (adenosine(37)-N6)-threonylcarbamoyltransferase complex dimerization subunit type 1 TsaB [Muribaculaceae bacterium]
MATILNIETSTHVCSVALTSDGMVLKHCHNADGRNHATLLSGYIKDCLDHSREHDMTLNAVAVSIGPGSYTGLRIGLSEAKGLAYALDLPLIGIDTLKLIAVGAMFHADLDPEALLAPMIDARRMEVYTAVYDFSLNALMPPCPLILDSQSYADFLNDREVYFMGDGSDKAVDVIRSPHARFIHGIDPLAADMCALSEQAYMREDFLDLAYSEPKYLKDFLVTKPIVKFCNISKG